MPANLLAVYGTLRPGGRWHGRIIGWPIIAEQACIAGRLIDTHRGYPGLKPGAHRVSVTLVAIPPGCLAQLDRFEDIRPGRGEYRRQRTWVWSTTGRHRAWVYFSRHAHGTIVASGDWLQTVAGRSHRAVSCRLR